MNAFGHCHPLLKMAQSGPLELLFGDPISRLINSLANAPAIAHSREEKIMNLVRFEPWAFADFLQRDIDRSANRRVLPNGAQGTAARWQPAIDIVEEKDRYVLLADVPGVNPDQIDVRMDDGILNVSGERGPAQQSELEGIRHFERVSGSFCRRFTLPDSADADNITASSSNGTLEIVIPKLPEVQPRRIAVEAA
ncbi:MAG TPA: Hsp20/alpha crystallin family protein [Hyphomicrobiales bacterium]|nr:Hsp20/alpha crystallin family protein [Hyphomicrobiales bacterium]